MPSSCTRPWSSNSHSALDAVVSTPEEHLFARLTRGRFIVRVLLSFVIVSECYCVGQSVSQ
jgi:hypothetical protein